MYTIQDVAKMANVSVATVSRVLNNSPMVTDKTREKVLDIINKTDYRPNLLGRNLRRMKTKMVLVLLPSISNPFYARVVKGIEDVAHKNGFNVMLCNTDSDQKRERMYMDLLENRLADGVIFMAPELSCDELSELSRKFPAVQCCEYKEGANLSRVSINNYSAAYQAVKYLLQCGHKRIGMISCKSKFLSTINREDGYKNSLNDFGINFDPDLIVYGDYSYNSGLDAARQLLSLPDRPTAIFSISDIMAIGAVKASKKLGYSVPKDLSVFGFDNLNLTYMYDPSLTTIAQPKYGLGCNAMELLLKQINGQMKGRQDIVLGFELKIRESTSQYKQ